MTGMTEMSPGTSRLRVLLATAGVAALAAAAAACGTSSSATTANPAGPEKPNIVVAAVSGEGAGGLYIAQDEGLFKKVGLHVTIQPVTSSSTVIPAMEHGSVDVSSGQYTSYIAVDAAGVGQLRILAAGYALGPHVQEIVVPGHSTITSPAQLKGKTIAVNALNSETTDLLYTALAPYGITPAQVKPVVIPFPLMPLALAASHVDAAFLIEPFITEAVKEHGVRELADIDTGASASIPISGYAVLASWKKKYPRTAAAFATAIRDEPGRPAEGLLSPAAPEPADYRRDGDRVVPDDRQLRPAAAGRGPDAEVRPAQAPVPSEVDHHGRLRWLPS
jgi:NitT/TauT family transport system substrate-binding protein